MNTVVRESPSPTRRAAPFYRCPFDGVHEEVCYAAGKRTPIDRDMRATLCRTDGYDGCPVLLRRNLRRKW